MEIYLNTGKKTQGHPLNVNKYVYFVGLFIVILTMSCRTLYNQQSENYPSKLLGNVEYYMHADKNVKLVSIDGNITDKDISAFLFSLTCDMLKYAAGDSVRIEPLTTIRAEIYIDKNGNTTHTCIANKDEADYYIIEQKLTEAILKKKLKWSPGEINGKKVNMIFPFIVHLNYQ